MIRVHDRELAFSATLLIQDGQEARIETQLDSWPIVVTLVFLPDESGSPMYSWQAVAPDHARITFKGWDARLGGIATGKPTVLGETATTKRAISFVVFHSRVGTLNRVDFQLLLGGTNG